MKRELRLMLLPTPLTLPAARSTHGEQLSSDSAVAAIFIPVRSRGRRHSARRVALYGAVAIGFVGFAFPLYTLLVTSLEPEHDLYFLRPQLLFSAFDWRNYTAAISGLPFLQGLGNSLIIVVAVEIGQLLSVPLAAYAFARLSFPLKKVLFGVLLGTMLLPYYVTVLPQYLIFRQLGWLNTFLPLTVPSFFGFGAGLYIFLFRQFYRTIPGEYDEAAMIDGCGRLRVFWHIILPQSKPVLAIMGLFTFVTTWNDYFGPLIYLSSPQKYTLGLDVYAWDQGQPYNRVMAMAAIMTVLPIAIFVLTQRYFKRGLVVARLAG
jgi:multiple sugar transport system permease protein